MFLYFKRDQMPVVHLVLSTPVHITNVNRLKRKKKYIAKTGDQFGAAVRWTPVHSELPQKIEASFMCYRPFNNPATYSVWLLPC